MIIFFYLLLHLRFHQIFHRIPGNQFTRSFNLTTVDFVSSTGELSDDIDYLTEYLCPSDSEDDSLYFFNEQNDDFYLETHLSKHKLNQIENIPRSKRSKKKINAQRQIKTKYAKSIKTKSHNKHLYIHHRLAKKVILDPPSLHCLPSSEPVSLYSKEELRSLVSQYRYQYYSSRINRHFQNSNEIYVDESHLLSTYQYREYTLNEHNIPDEQSYDDDMVNFLLEMQNRDL